MRSRDWIASVLAMAALSCAVERPYVWVHDVPQEAVMKPTIQPGDKIFLLVAGQPTLSGEYVVAKDGAIVQPVAGRIVMAGLTAEDASRQIAARLKGMLVEPQVSVSITAPRRPEINVVGEVTKPGHFDIDQGAGVLEALARAGGLTEFADTDGIFVIRGNPVRMRVRFRYEDLAGGDARSVSFALHDGDVVVVE